MSCRTSCRNLSLVLALLALVTLAAPAFATGNGLCITDAYNSFNGTHKNLSCTAGDVKVAAVKQGSVNVFQGGVTGHPNECISGTSFSFTAQFEIVTTSSSARSNIGIFFGDGTTALTGTCTDAILAPQYPCAPVNGVNTATCGSTDYEELDQSINGETSPSGCGDTSSTDPGTTFGVPGSQASVLEVDGVTCPTTASACPAGSGLTGTCLALPTCTGWYQPANGMPVCNSPTHTWVPAAIPGTSSKCSCGIVYVPVIPVTITPSVTKACTTNLTAGPSAGPCDAGPEGSTVTYTVSISNPSTTTGNNAVVDQICDNRYGTVSTTTGFTPACPTTGVIGTVASTTCPPTPVAPGGTGTCTFTAVQGENASVTDTVTAWGHSSLNPSVTFGGLTGVASNSVTVTSSDAASTASTSKGLEPGPRAACVTLRYDATVTNTSGHDESLVLNSSSTPTFVPALRDTFFGDITSTHGNASTSGSVTGTTCGVANGVAGSGTASDLTASDYTDGGAFPKTLDIAGGTHPTYTCQFDGVLCGTPGPIGTTCAEGIQTPSSTLAANLTGDDTSGDSLTTTNTPFTATVCFAQSGQ